VLSSRNRFEIVTERRPVDGIFQVALLGQGVSLHGGGQRSHGILSHDLESDALHEIAERTRVDQQALLGMRQHIDEPGRHRLARRVDLILAVSKNVAADPRNAITLDRNVGNELMAAGTVVNGAAADHEIPRRAVGRGVHRTGHCKQSRRRETSPHGSPPEPSPLFSPHS